MSIATFLQGVSPFGPIFGKELRTTARRKRTYWLRVLYLGMLLLVLFIAYSITAEKSQYSAGVARQNQQQSELGQTFFACFAIFSVFIMGLLGPILTATAISSERQAKTLPVLLMTPITAWQIVAGKLFSRLFAALTLIGLGLPVLALVRLLGGVELEQMLGATAMAIVAVLFSAALGLFFSTLMNRAFAVLLLSFAVMLLLYAFVPFILAMLTFAQLRSSGGPGSPAAMYNMMQIMLALNPYAMASVAANSSGYAATKASFQLPWVMCIGLHLGATALLLMLSALILRRRARRAGESHAGMPAPPPPLPYASMETAAVPALPLFPAAQGTAPPPLPPPIVLSYLPAGAERARKARVVADNPVLWREVRRPLLPRVWQKIVSIVIVGLLTALVYIVLEKNDALREPEPQSVWACIFNFIVGGLTLIISATVISQERESDTWTLLLATPISGYTIVWGKAAGVARRLIWPVVFVALHFLLFAVCGVITFTAAFTAVWVIITFNTLWIATGVYFSLRFRKTTAAVIANLALALAAGLLVFVVLGIFTEIGPDAWGSRAEAPGMQAGISVLFVLVVGWWCFALFFAFRRERGALGHLMIATLVLIPAFVMFAVNMEWIPTQEAPHQVGWYVPFYFLAQIGTRSNHDFRLPVGWGQPAHVFLGVVLIVGALHLLAAAFILTMTAAKFSALVGRAPQLDRLPKPDPSAGARQMLLSPPRA